MKQLTCEMCGSTELMKQDGVFVCQTCGTKYSVEEAKKMMVEGTVEVAGTVKVDDSAKIANYFTMAENAYDANNKKEAESYCNKIIEIEPNNYKAWMLKGKAAGWQSTLANIRIEEAVNCFTKAIDNAPEDELKSIKAEVSEEISDLSQALVKLSCNNFARWPSQENYEEVRNASILVKKYALLLLAKCGVTTKDFNKDLATKMNNSAADAWKNRVTVDYQHSNHPGRVAYDTFRERCLACAALITDAINLCNNDDSEDVQRYKNLIHIYTEYMNGGAYHYGQAGWSINYCLTAEGKQQVVTRIMGYHNKIKEIDPSYTIPAPPVPKSTGCYVATAVYGSYDCPEVWTLRRFRDYTLAETWYGRAFIHTYYAISPTLVKWFGHTVWFKKMWKGKLDRMVAKLQASGVKSTPYKDKEW